MFYAEIISVGKHLYKSNKFGEAVPNYDQPIAT